jgi:hypothetical protein
MGSSIELTITPGPRVIAPGCVDDDPAGLRGVVNDPVDIYFLDPSSAAGLLARWCGTSKVETTNGAFQIREDDPKKRVPLKDHKTP